MRTIVHRIEDTKILCECCQDSETCIDLNPYKCHRFCPTISSNYFVDTMILQETPETIWAC